MPQSILVDVGFDARGNLSGETAPYYDGEPYQITSYAYDPLDRRVLTARDRGAQDDVITLVRRRPRP